MVLDEARGVSIHGEIWEVDADCLMRLDDLEDIAGGEYARELIPLLPPYVTRSQDVDEAPAILRTTLRAAPTPAPA